MKTLLAIITILCFCETVHAQTNDSTLADDVRQSRPFLSEKANAFRLSLELNVIHVRKETFWLGFTIYNRSNLSFPIDFIRLYIKDRKQAKRSSAQELEILPIYMDTITNVPAKRTEKFVIAVPKFTIPDNKECLIEIFETNGGRNLTMKITNQQLFKAKSL